MARDGVHRGTRLRLAGRDGLAPAGAVGKRRTTRHRGGPRLHRLPGCPAALPRCRRRAGVLAADPPGVDAHPYGVCGSREADEGAGSVVVIEECCAWGLPGPTAVIRTPSCGTSKPDTGVGVE